MKKNKIIVLIGILIISFCSNGSFHSSELSKTIPAKIESSDQYTNSQDTSVVNGFDEQHNFEPNNFEPNNFEPNNFEPNNFGPNNFIKQISIIKNLPTRIEFSNDQEISLSLTKEEIKKKYEQALEEGLLIKQDIGFKEVVLYVDLDEEGQIDRMVAEFIHASSPTYSFAKEFE